MIHDIKSVLKMSFLSELVMQVDDLHVSVGDLIVLDVTEVVSGIQLLGKGLAHILVYVVHSGGPCVMSQA